MPKQLKAAVVSDSPYVMELDLRVLDHLGIKLYSNAAAVLSEAVANSWDADAQTVQITLESDRIVIDDDGTGMDLTQINDRFLKVGYDKRSAEGETSDKGRSFMGRKGIGKLALFSIADRIEVHTARKAHRHAFEMKTADIKATISSGKQYRPTPIAYAGTGQGTRVILDELKKKRTAKSIAALRKRVARRFSIIGYKGASNDTFDVRINGNAVGPDDRDDLKAVEFLWEFSETDPSIPGAACPGLEKRFLLSGIVDQAHSDWLVRGWIGAASRPQTLRNDEAESLNGIVVLARGRLIQENVLDKLNFSRILVSYLTGHVEADFLDSPDAEDIATSDRQRLVEDDERYVALVKFLRATLVSISDGWTALRNEVRGREAIKETPPLGEWIDTLPDDLRSNARKLVGVIKGVEVDDEEDRKSLYRSGMLAFERLRLREAAHLLGSDSELTAAHLLPLLADLATLEGSLYREIVKSRLDVIRKFEKLVDGNEKEKVLQQHLFDNLWLLDPGWERAAGSERIEQQLRKEYSAFKPTLTEKQSKGRVDIRYRTNGGEHIIIELKRAGRRLRVDELIAQGNKYRVALQKCLRKVGIDEPHISIVFVVGTPLDEEDDPGGHQMVRDTLGAIKARVIQYETLIRGAQEAYAEYLERSRQTDRLDTILSAL